MHFKARAGEALADATLQANLHKFGSAGLAALRAKAVVEYGPAEFEALRDASATIRNRGLENLPVLLERFEREASRRGATVLYARTGTEIRDLVLEIAARHGLKKAVKSKSMLSEEAALNDALAGAGVEPIETDLGEYIIQLAHEPPSHIIVPAVHKTRAQVADLFDAAHRPLGYTKHLTEVSEMVNEARQGLPRHYFEADVGGSGDPHGLLGRVKETASLAAMGAEHYMDSVLLGDSAYKVTPGFTGVPIVEAPAGAKGTEKNEDRELLARFLLDNL